LDEFNVEIQTRISDEIERCEKTARLLGHYAQELAIASGKSTNQDIESIQTKFYFNVDVPFRQWLWSVDAEQENIEEKLREWEKNCYKIAMDMAKEMVRNVNINAHVGHKMKENPERPMLYTAPKAYNEFQRKLRKIYPKSDMEGGSE
jgi:CRISPR system Cascade subunit CasA